MTRISYLLFPALLLCFASCKPRGISSNTKDVPTEDELSWRDSQNAARQKSFARSTKYIECDYNGSDPAFHGNKLFFGFLTMDVGTVYSFAQVGEAMPDGSIEPEATFSRCDPWSLIVGGCAETGIDLSANTGKSSLTPIALKTIKYHTDHVLGERTFGNCRNIADAPGEACPLGFNGVPDQPMCCPPGQMPTGHTTPEYQRCAATGQTPSQPSN